MDENVAIHTSKCPICGNEVNLFIFYNDKIVGCKYCGVNIPKRSNGDRIRSMTDEEMAELFWIRADCKLCPNKEPYCSDDCKKHWLDWLKQEVSNEK